MRGVIIKESKILDEALRGEIDKKTLLTLRVLCKYYLLDGKSKDEADKELNDYMSKYYDDYKPSKWRDIIKQLIKSVAKLDTYEIIDVDNIDITVDEWDKIMLLEGKQLQKLAFILLVYSKVGNVRGCSNNNKVSVGITDVLSESKLRVSSENKLLLNALVREQYISTSLVCDSTTITVLYSGGEEIKFTINNFENVLSYYDEYANGKKYVECEVCKKRIVQNSKKPMKYCGKCAKKVDNDNRSFRKR